MTMISKAIYRFNVISIKIPKGIFHRTRTKILKFVQKLKRHQIAKTILRKKVRAGRITLPDLRLYCKATVIKILRHWHKNRHLDQWNRIESPEINSGTYGQLIKKEGKLLCQVNMAGWPAVSASSRWLKGIQKWYYNTARFNKLGLMRDDTIHENDDVKEAIRRLPENLYNDRVFRIKRALDLSMRQQILPKEQWTNMRRINSTLNHIWKRLFKKEKREKNGQRNNLVV